MDNSFEEKNSKKNQILSIPNNNSSELDINTNSINPSSNIDTSSIIDANSINTISTNIEINLNNNVSDTTANNPNKTNCLALTIKEEHKLVAVKNVFLHSIKVTWKVIASAIALHILKIFL